MKLRSALALVFSGVMGMSGASWARQPADRLPPPAHTMPKVFGWNEVPAGFVPHERLGRMMHIDSVRGPSRL
jgi:hypothetical protein